MSLGEVATRAFTDVDTTPHDGHAAAASSAVTTCTTRVPSALRSTRSTRTPGSPNDYVVPSDTALRSFLRLNARILVRWHKARWRCREDYCDRGSFTEAIAQVPARSRATVRLRTAIGAVIGDAARSVAEVAAAHGVSWPCATSASARLLERSGLALEGRLARYGMFPNISAEPQDVMLFV